MIAPRTTFDNFNWGPIEKLITRNLCSTIIVLFIGAATMHNG